MTQSFINLTNSFKQLGNGNIDLLRLNFYIYIDIAQKDLFASDIRHFPDAGLSEEHCVILMSLKTENVTDHVQP